MKNTSIVLFLTIALISSCKENKEQNNINAPNSKVIKITSKDLNDRIIESQLFDSVSFIPIFLPGDEPIGSISAIQLYRNNYYILDPVTQKIHEFNKDWAFKKTLFFQGAGPNEYNEIFNFSFINNSIVINDLLKVVYYDLEDFKPIKSYRKNHMGFRTYLTHDEHILNYQLNSPFDDSHFNVSIYNYTNDSITYQGSPIPKNLKGFTFSQKNPFFSNNGSDYFIEAFNDTIYKVENGTLSKYRFIDFQDIRFEIDKLIGEPGITSVDVMQSDKAYFLGDYLNNESIETFSFTYKARRYIYMSNKKDSVFHIYSSMIQDKTVLQLPIDYFLLDGQNIFSAKDIEQAKYELEMIKEKIASNPDLQIHQSTVETLSEKLKDASAVIIKIHVN